MINTNKQTNKQKKQTNKQTKGLKTGTSSSQVEHATTEPMGIESVIHELCFFSYRQLVNAKTSMHKLCKRSY